MSTVVSTALDREQLILSHLPQVHLLAMRAHHRCPPEVALEDLVSAGTVGLIQAVNRYDPSRNLKLKTLAEHRIRGAILDHLRQLDPLSRSLRQFQRKRDIAFHNLKARLGRVSSDTEIAYKLGIPLSKYRRLERELCAGSLASLETCIDEVGDKAVAGPNPIAALEKRDRQQKVSEAIQSLPARERSVLDALLKGRTPNEIASQLRLHESRVSQIKRLAISKLRIVLGVANRGSVAHNPRQGT